MNHPGEYAALLTAVFWTITALAFTHAGKRIGSLSVNFWRLIVGFLLLTAFVGIRYNFIIPDEISGKALLWLSLSGFMGIFLGDLFLFKAFLITGPRVALLVMSFSPPFAAVIAWFLMGETLSLWGIIGMTITMIGIFMVILKRGSKVNGERNIQLRYSPKGIFYAFLGMIGQSAGLVMSKVGLMESHNAFTATQIRVIAGLLGFVLLISFMNKWRTVLFSIKDGKAFASLSLGSFFGPFLGISFSLIAISYTNPGIVQTIVSINPILIIPFSIWFLKEKITWLEVFGAMVAVTGIAMFFL
ncbi:MAG: DMT family transporter [Bacteroidales bacterium]|nr:DMT family transporter [Bacteroidales bacterium]